MQSEIETQFLAHVSKPVRTTIWIVLVASSSVVFSLALACATPFAALATIAGLRMARRDALALVGVAWFVNQAVGLLLSYPRTWDSFAWGAAIGIAAVLATFVVTSIANRFGARTVAAVFGFVVAFGMYEATLFAASAILPSGADAFSLTTLSLILWVNVLALSGLFVMYHVAVAIGLMASGANASLAMR
jgi:hypothetical protein